MEFGFIISFCYLFIWKSDTNQLYYCFIFWFFGGAEVIGEKENLHCRHGIGKNITEKVPQRKKLVRLLLD